MAVMIPEELDDDPKITSSERAFFEALRDQLSDEFYVYVGLPFLDKTTARQGELDFLVLHPHHGMLVIECKGGGVIRDKNGNWFRVSAGGGRDKLRRSPMEQASDQIRAIRNKLDAPAKHMFPGLQHNQFPMVTGWALAFPYATWDRTTLPPELEPEILLDQTSLANLEESVVTAMVFYTRNWSQLSKVPRLTNLRDFHRFREGAISPSLDLAPRISGRIAVERQQLLRLTQEQSYIVDFVVENRRTRIRGGAGTGKTIVARQAAQHLAARGNDVLLTCFNSNLAKYLAESVAAEPELPGSILALHFHSLCYQAGLLLERPLKPPRDPDAQRHYWTEEAPYVLLQAIEQKKLGPWDAIIVDEAQDFAEIWWEVLEQGLKDPQGGKIAAFFDPAQRIFTHGGAIPDYGTVLPLKQNFRNTKAIAAALRTLTDVDMTPHPRCHEGEPPAVYAQPGEKKTRRMLTELLDTLITRGHLKPNQIAILTPRSAKNSSLAGRTELGEHKIVHNPTRWQEGVLHTTIGKFKGLEADVVIMLDIVPDDERCSPNARYVAASRARHRLYVFSRGNWLET